MAGLSFEFDATGSAIGGGNPDGTAYALSTANGYDVLGYDAPEPDEEIQWASSADTEGEKRAGSRPRNRTVTIRVRLAKSTDALVESEFNALGKKVGKLRREGGTLKVTHPSGTVGYFDVQAAGQAFPWDHRLVRVKRGEITITLTCDPYLRTAETSISLGTPISTAGGVHVWVPATGIPGDVTALGRLTLTDSASQNQGWLTWGIQSRYYSNASSALLFYQAESLTAMGGSATAAGPTGASGSGSNVMRNTGLTANYQAILSTQASGGGSHLSHVGTFRVYARVQVPTTNTGLVTLALEWGSGDFLRYKRNDTEATAITTEQEGLWVLVDLGLVQLRKVAQGTQRWEGRIVAKSTVIGDDIDIDYLVLVPADEGSGVVSRVIRDFTPTSYVARDEFTGTTAGNALNGRAAPVGGTWATSGSATDYTFADSTTGFDEHVTRNAAGSRYAILGSTDYTAIAVSARTDFGGVLARWTDSSNYLVGRYDDSSPVFELAVFIAGVETVLGSVLTGGVRGRLTLTALANGYVRLTLTERTAATTEAVPDLLLEAYHPALATGGTLATGKIGFSNGNPVFTVTSRVDDFWAAVPPVDAAMFASQSLEVRHDRVEREDSGGSLWVRPSSYLGDYLLVPPAGAEARSLRVVAKGSRLDPALVDVASTDTMTGTLNVTPRFLAMPD